MINLTIQKFVNKNLKFKNIIYVFLFGSVIGFSVAAILVDVINKLIN